MNSLSQITNTSLNQVNGNLNTYINHQIAQNKDQDTRGERTCSTKNQSNYK